MKRNWIKQSLLLPVLLLVAFVTADSVMAEAKRGFRGEGPAADGVDAPLKTRLRVGATVPTFDHPAFTAITAGMQQAADDYNIEITILDGQNDPAKQLSQIESFITQGMDAIMIDAVDEIALGAGMIAANEAGIPVMHFDRRVTGGGEPFVYVGTEWLLNGVLSGTQIVQMMNAAGNLVVIEGTVGSAVTRDNSNGAMAVIDLYPDLKVIASVSGNFNRHDSLKVIEDILQAHPDDIDAIWYMDDEMYFGAQAAIAGSGRAGEIQQFSIDGDRRAGEAIQRGELDGDILLDIYGMGYEPVRFVAQYLNGRRDFPEWIKLWTTAIDASNIDKYIDMCW